MKFYQLIIVFLFCFTFSSCEKNESLYEELADGTQLHKVLIEGEVYQEFTYNDAGLILEEKSKYFYTNHNYNSRNQLVRTDHYMDWRIVSSSSHVLDELAKRTEWVSSENTELDSYFELSYNDDGKLSRRDVKRVKTDSESYSRFTYNSNGRVERRTAYNEDEAFLFDNYFYDTAGNLVREERYLILENGTEELQTRTDYKFDAKMNPYISFRGLMIPGRNTNRNNIVEKRYEHFFEVSGLSEKVSVTNDSYAYNENGYPIRKNGNLEFIYY